MLHLIWYILVGLIAGIIAKSIMHAHLTIFWTIVLGIIGSIIGGAVTHMFVPPRDQRFHPAYFLHVGCDPGAICLLQTQDSISARVESRENGGVSWLLEAIDLQDSQTAPTSGTGKPRALTRWETRPHRRLRLAQFSVRSGRTI